MKKSILVVDDNLDSRKIFELMLEENYELHFAENGLQGFELFQRLKVDLVLSDVEMPVRSGIWLLQEIIKLTRDVPVVMVTSTLLMSEKEFYSKGAKGVIWKPYSFLDVLKVIKNLI